ncbi:hypothetical protein PLESTB_000738300 [Pleodorina starrii]|uniref:FAM50A/XAP5 C-terminal domain-containing protein n=1 Tax=Pleodorina starrii TaxID=330485 RepID=A0A9W6BK76_9CHLO|nr:hypothetical protein PLESTM_000186000 [Pleodorina starrii]GLC53378.1 hypothetical protein PLESTB_000738300 [Pleodorina starrii]GLC67152.1 hypothetical protein PLESTF_000522800 [Pleodorina starrii]
MFNNGYVGTGEDVQRIRRMEKQREEQRKKFEQMQKQTKDQADAAGLRQFGASTEEALEHAFKNETVGLVTKAEFIQKRTTLQERLEEEHRRKAEADEDAASREREKRKREKEARKPKLSFLVEEDGGEEAEGEGEEAGRRSAPPPAASKFLPAWARAAAPAAPAPAEPAAAAAAAAPAPAGASEAVEGRAGSEEPAGSSGNGNGSGNGSDGEARALAASKRRKFGKFGKDPTVATDFLPDKDRERLEAEMRAALRKEWQLAQDAIKAEPLTITYSYWNGTGHRRNITIKKGDSIGLFLKAVREQLAPEFRELRHVGMDNLMYIKEDLIMPHHHTFYDLIINKARGKSGPLFDFSVREDIRVTNDATQEKQDSHAGKVVERHWYDKNKHIFPASRWEIYDPEKKYGEYTIFG